MPRTGQAGINRGDKGHPFRYIFYLILFRPVSNYNKNWNVLHRVICGLLNMHNTYSWFLFFSVWQSALQFPTIVLLHFSVSLSLTNGPDEQDEEVHDQSRITWQFTGKTQLNLKKIPDWPTARIFFLLSFPFPNLQELSNVLLFWNC